MNEMYENMKLGQGFIAALDQSGGSTPKALRNYGVEEKEYQSEEEMFDIIHQMRTRIITSPAFTNDHILGAILFEKTMDSQIEGKPTAKYLWDVKGIIPFLKVDKGLAEEQNGVQLMKDMPNLDGLLNKALENSVFGTKMRSVIHSYNEEGIKAIVDQQFAVGKEIIKKGLMPILEPEVDIHSQDRSKIEELLKKEILEHLDKLDDTEHIMLKLTIPETPGLYNELIAHPKVLRVVALSGGFTREEANEKLCENPGLIASFSRALINELKVQMSDDEFNRMLKESIESIYSASIK